MYKTVHLKKGKEESLGRFHPWVFSGAIHHIDGTPEEGDVVRVVSADGRFLAVGHIQIGSIAVRVLSFEDITIDKSFWQQRLAAAYDVRKSIFPQWKNQKSEIRIQTPPTPSASYTVRATDSQAWSSTSMTAQP